MFCREEAVQLHRELHTIRERGAELVMIGNGNRHFAAAFAEEFGITSPLYVDTKRDSYSALDMKRGFFATLGSLASFGNMRRAMRAGFRQGLTRGDAWQLGGVLVVDRDGEILYKHRSEAAGDKAPAAEVLGALPGPR
jgi:peroxiredoxin